MSLEGKRKNRWQYILFNLLHFTLFRVHLVLAFLTISVLMCPPMSWFITMVIKWLGLVNGLWFSINEHKVYCHVKCVKLLAIKIILYWCFILWLFKPEKKSYCNIRDETKYKNCIVHVIDVCIISSWLSGLYNEILYVSEIHCFLKMYT